MHEKEISFRLQVFENENELPAEEASLLQKAKAAIPDAYAPYSGFKVAATVLLQNGASVSGTNQENAAFPVCICAEGTALSAASAQFPNVPITKIAVTVKSSKQILNHPVAPCGVCRQRLLEYENRSGKPIKIIMQGESGEVYVANSVKELLPLQFSGSDL